MTKRIKLTEEDIQAKYEGDFIFNLEINCNLSEIEADQLKAQILDDHEKGEKWDILENAKTHEALVKYAELEQENKQLKESLKKEFRISLEYQRINSNLKQKLEKIQEHLEKQDSISYCVDGQSKSGGDLMDELKEILESK